MASTRQNVKFLQQRMPNYSPTQVLERLNEAHRLVYSSDSDQFIKIDSSTGLPPLLATTEGQYQYTCPSDCRRTYAVLSQKFVRRLTRSVPVGPQREYYLRNKGFHRMEVTSTDRLRGVDPTVTFQFDPGTTTDVFYHVYTLEPNNIATLEDELQIPEHLHYLIRDVTLLMFAEEEYGENQRKHQAIERMFRRIRSEMNRGTQARLEKTPWGEEFQVFYDNGYYAYLS